MSNAVDPPLEEHHHQLLNSAKEHGKVAVLGGGAWGTALAIHCARLGHKTVVWALEEAVVEGINGPAR